MYVLKVTRTGENEPLYFVRSLVTPTVTLHNLGSQFRYPIFIFSRNRFQLTLMLPINKVVLRDQKRDILLLLTVYRSLAIE